MTKEKIKQTLFKHKSLLKKYHVKSIALFGSSVRGEGKKGSDIDLLVEFDENAFGKNFEGYYDNYIGLLNAFKKIFKKKIDLVTSDMISPYIKPYVVKEAEFFEAA